MGLPCCAPLADPRCANFAEERLNTRLGLIFEALQRRPNAGFSRAFPDWASRKAAYRFLAHPQTPVDALLPALVVPTARQASALAGLYAVHDSTSFNYTHLACARGLGYLNDSPRAKGLHL